MNEFEFTLKFSLPDTSSDAQNYVDALGGAGCDDAIIGIGQKGRLALQFTREANSGLDAVTSAIRDVKSAIPEAILIESTPDLVGLSDIAELLGFSRQYLRKMMTTKENFPLPVHSGKTAIWRLSNFLRWYETEQKNKVSSTMQEIASANMQINIAKELSQLDQGLKENISSINI